MSLNVSLQDITENLNKYIRTKNDECSQRASLIPPTLCDKNEGNIIIQTEKSTNIMDFSSIELQIHFTDNFGNKSTGNISRKGNQLLHATRRQARSHVRVLRLEL